MKGRANILITAVGAPPGLNALRALKEANCYNLIAADADPRSPALYCFSTEHVILPKASEQEAYLDTLVRLITQRQISAVLPCIEEEILCLSEHHKKVEACGANLLIPDKSVLEAASDKGKSTFIAISNRIPCPRSKLLSASTVKEERHEIMRQFSRECELPWITKPTRGHGMRGIFYISDMNEADAILEKTDDELLFQEFIPAPVGNMHLVGLLYDREGKVVRRYSSRSIRTLYPTGGPATAGVTTKNEELVAATENLIGLIGNWRGPVNAEWMLDPRDGIMKFIEINPRLWGYGYLAVRAGINFPLAVVDLCLGKDIGSDPGYVEGMTMLRITEDIVFERCPFPID